MLFSLLFHNHTTPPLLISMKIRPDQGPCVPLWRSLAWFFRVSLKGRVQQHHRIKFNIYHIHGVLENQYVRVFTQMTKHWSLHRLKFCCVSLKQTLRSLLFTVGYYNNNELNWSQSMGTDVCTAWNLYLILLSSVLKKTENIIHCKMCGLCKQANQKNMRTHRTHAISDICRKLAVISEFGWSLQKDGWSFEKMCLF